MQDDGKASQRLNRCKAQITQLTHIIGRLHRRRQGLREHNITRLVNSLIYSRILYVLPYVKLTSSHRSQHDRLIRPATRLALGVSRYTPLCWTLLSHLRRCQTKLIFIWWHNKLISRVPGMGVLRYPHFIMRCLPYPTLRRRTPLGIPAPSHSSSYHSNQRTRNFTSRTSSSSNMHLPLR